MTTQGSYGAIGGEFLDHADFEPALSRAGVLGVHIYVHRASPLVAMRELCNYGLGDARVGRVHSYGFEYGRTRQGSRPKTQVASCPPTKT